MDQTNSLDWYTGESLEGTVEPVVSAIEEEVPTLAVGTIIAVSLIMLIAIAMVFLLGVFIDWRHQRIMEDKMKQIRRLKNSRRVNAVVDAEDAEDAGIVNNMAALGISAPPILILHHVP